MTPEALTALAERNVYVYVIVTLVGAVASLFVALLWQVRKGTDIQEKRIADRDRFQAELTELARSTSGIVQKNTEGLFVFAKQLEALHARKRAPMSSTGGAP